MEIKVIQETCCSEGCGIPFWIDAEHHDRLFSTKRTFYCPNGHPQSYRGESDATKAIRLQGEKNQLEREKNSEIQRLQGELRKKCRKPKAKK